MLKTQPYQDQHQTIRDRYALSPLPTSPTSAVSPFWMFRIPIRKAYEFLNSSFLVSFFQHHLNHFLETQLLSTSISSLTHIETVRIIARHSMSMTYDPNPYAHIYKPIYSLHCILFECHFLRLLICLHQYVCCDQWCSSHGVW